MSFFDKREKDHNDKIRPRKIKFCDRFSFIPENPSFKKLEGFIEYAIKKAKAVKKRFPERVNTL